MTITLLLESGPVSVAAEPSQTILDVVQAQAGLPIHAPCGGQGTCRKCTVYLSTEQGEQAVLACRTPVEDGMMVRLPSAAPLSVQTESNADQNVLTPDSNLSGYGIACDIGTTTVVCHLIDLTSGRTLATVGEGNAQRPYGGDVIARIKAAMEGRLPALTAAITEQLARLIEALCKSSGVTTDAVTRMTIAANTVMCHLLTGLDPTGIGVAPFKPESLFGGCHDARKMGLPFDGELYIIPAVSSYVGGDITADLLAANLDQENSPVLMIDVGTNGEMALGCGDHFTCCSTAAGPAFEGAQIHCGMTAAPGAVSTVQYLDGQVVCGTIGGLEPVGLCGSGLIDALAVMLDLGAIDETGRVLDVDDDDIPDAAAPYLFLLDGEPAFRLIGDIVVTQSDVRKVQLGKGAIAAGVKVLLDSYGTDFSQISALLLAGGFGSFIRPSSAARIGLIPAELLSVTRAIGNAAALGAQEALVSADARRRLDQLQKNMDYKELSGLPAFNEAYMEAMMFPEEE